MPPPKPFYNPLSDDPPSILKEEAVEYGFIGSHRDQTFYSANKISYHFAKTALALTT